MSVVTRSTGRARIVLVFGSPNNARAIITSVIVHTKNNTDGNRISFAGSVAFEESTIEHISDVLVPIVDKIMGILGLGKRNFEISIVNPGGVSVSDLSVKVSGFSADVPILLAMLSAALGLGITDDIVSTGHIASSDGDIAVVKAIPAKISAALEDKSISGFIYPALDKDSSLSVLSPVEKEKTEIAVINAKGKLKMTAVKNIANLVKEFFTDEAIVLSSLQEGFFGLDGSGKHSGNPVSAAVRFLAGNNQKRFWDVLERYFHAGDNEGAKRLLLVFSRFHITSEMYPKEFGRKLLQLLRSLPPSTRKNRIVFPVLPTLECVRLTQFAGQADSGDIGLLYDAAEGKSIWAEPSAAPRAKSSNDLSEKDQGQMLVDSVISQIDSIALAKTVAVPIDTARTTYMLNSLTVKSNEEFFDVVSAFYLHLQRHIHSVSESIDINTIKNEAVALVERTFADKGGITAAMNEASAPIHGGMRFILDCLTDKFKAESQTRHINRIIQEILGPLDRDVQLSFISALLKRLSPHLPQEIASAQPERFVDHYETIAKEYVKSLDKINETFRRF